MVPNSWPNKEQILLQAQEERRVALEERAAKRDAAKKRREWEKNNPEAARIKEARAAAHALQLEQARRESRKNNQQFASQLLKVIPRCNCLVQVLDARAPLSGISDSFETMVAEHQERSLLGASDHEEKTLVYILNKVDLVPRSHLDAWTKYLSASVLLDDDRLKIKRRIALYSTESTDSPLALLKTLQTVWLKGAKKHKIVAAVVGFSHTGKGCILRDMEAASNIVTVHPSSVVPSDDRMKIPGAREVAMVTLPTDSDLVAKNATGLNLIYKDDDVFGSSATLETLVSVADQLVAGGLRVCTHFKIAKVASGKELLEAIATKRGMRTAEGEHCLVTAGKAMCMEISSGKLMVLASAAEAGLEPKTYGSSQGVVEPVHANFAAVQRTSGVSAVKAIVAPAAAFETADHKVALMMTAESDDDDDEEGSSDEDKYVLEDKDWKQDDVEMGDDEEMEEVEEGEEGEEMEED